LEHISE
jgi:hypothetical protein